MAYIGLNEDQIEQYKKAGIPEGVLNNFEYDTNIQNKDKIYYRATIKTDYELDETEDFFNKDTGRTEKRKKRVSGYIYFQLPVNADKGPIDSVNELFNGNKDNVVIKYAEGVTRGDLDGQKMIILDYTKDGLAKSPIEFAIKKFNSRKYEPLKKYESELESNWSKASVVNSNKQAINLSSEIKLLLGNNFDEVLEMLPETNIAGENLYTKDNLSKLFSNSTAERLEFIRGYGLNDYKALIRKLRGDFTELNFMSKYNLLIQNNKPDFTGKVPKKIISVNKVEINSEGKIIFDRSRNVNTASDFTVEYEDGTKVNYEIKNTSLQRVVTHGTFALTDKESLKYFADRGYNPIIIKQALETNEPLTEKKLGKQSDKKYNLDGTLSEEPRTTEIKKYIYINSDADFNPEYRIYDPMEEVKQGTISKRESVKSGDASFNLCSIEINKIPKVEL